MTLATALDAVMSVFFPLHDRTELGRYCTVCDTVHGERCPREVKRWCMDCLSFRVLDRYFRCSTCRSQSLAMSVQPDDYGGAWRETLKLDGTAIEPNMEVM